MNKLQVALEILNVLNQSSFEAYLVGGAVRDYILDKEIEDVDITTNATLSELTALFDNVRLEGSKYMSCRIYQKGMMFEVTTFRKDLKYLDHRHPVSILAKTLEEDLLRRDFTMNALVMDRDEMILDLFHGIMDIKQGIIRMIGNPELRFEEDALRVLRAVYFASKLNFVIEERILHSFKKDYIKYLKEEYIVEMLNKIMDASYDTGLHYIMEYQLLRCYPFYQVMCEDVLKYKYRKNSYALFYALHHFLPSNLKISSKIRYRAKAIFFWLKHKFNALALYYGNEEILEDSLEIYEKITGISLLKEELLQQKINLPIASPKDIKFCWNKIKKEKRNQITRKLEHAILLNEIKNEEVEIEKYLEIEE